ncbi:lectin like domain-containing protein [uncultured Methanobrevibacter sp.]|uniref:lectin like domain-containing protein n=1 Tax=uncultured Methanobrevibacter sp. TaxID=253161 RepID=UPI0026104E18|nr:Ig-like domain repeat protein [uncultured Methanobrevibacter sp.]
MKLNSRHIIFLLIICILFSITAVSASDNQAIDVDNGLSQSIDGMSADVDNGLSQSIDGMSADEDVDQDSGLSEDNLCEIEINEKNVDDLIDDGENYHTFTELNQSISESGDELYLTHDYRYDENLDKDTFLNEYGMLRFSVDKGEFVINGNNHVIDGAGIGPTFDFENEEGNIVINDLTFKNFKKTALITYGKITLNNVNFTGCSEEEDGIIYVSSADLTVNGCSFYSNNASILISAYKSNVTVNNSIFSGNNNYGQAISASRWQLIIHNSIFENFSFNNGAMIDFKGHRFEMVNSSFINAHSDLSGGVILAKYFPAEITIAGEKQYLPSDPILIDNCKFENVSCANDGGAIHIDLDSGAQHIQKTMNIVGSNFTNCSSKYGGAISVLGGALNIESSKFLDNYASFEGGAIYSSWTALNITNSNFRNNTAAKNAGALYFDKGNLTIKGSNFISNKAHEESSTTANAIYAHDVAADFSDSTFDNGGVGVYADFASDSTNVEKNYDIFLMDNHNYIVSVETPGIKLNLINNEIIVDSLPSKFDARDWGWVTPEKFQGDNDDCWAFATVASIETALLKSTGVSYNLSQNYVQKLQLKYYEIGDLRNSLTGFSYSGLGYALSWYGVLVTDADYDDRGMIADTDMDVPRIHVQDAMFIYTGMDDTIDLLKRAIIKYGAVTVQYYVLDPEVEIPTEGEDIALMDHVTHFISLIGWDETRPISDGEPNGLWLTKDSLYGFSEAEYINFPNIDYYAIVPQSVGIAYIFENDIDYHVNYQTDLTGLTGFDENYTYYSNEFTSKYDEFIGAVGTYFNESGINYSFDVFVNNKKVHTQSGVSEFAGFRTIVLDKYIPIKAGDQFKVVFKSNAVPYQAWSRVHYLNGTSLTSNDGNSWTDFAPLNKTVCLKVYTVEEDKEVKPTRISTRIDCKNMTTYAVAKEDGRIGEYFKVTLKDSEGNPLANKPIQIGFNGKVYDKTTDKDGKAELQINLGYKGTYTFAIGFIGDDDYLGAFEVAKITVNVQTPKLTAANKSYKATAKTKALTATFKTSHGKAIVGKRISFIINGRTYTAKTNLNGVATVNVSLNKKGTYSFTVKYAGDSTFATASKKAKLTLK